MTRQFTRLVHEAVAQTPSGARAAAAAGESVAVSGRAPQAGDRHLRADPSHPASDGKSAVEEEFQIGPQHFINRELSWLEFNARVLEEAQDEHNPPLERLKFLSIVSSNLDEFFMVRVAGLREQAFGDGAPQDVPPDGMSAIEQLSKIAERTQRLVADQYACWNDKLRPKLAAEGIRIVSPGELTPDGARELDDFFHDQVFPIVTPMAIDPSHPRPVYHNRGLYLATILDRHCDLGPRRLFAVVQLPSAIGRLIPIRAEAGRCFVLLEELIGARLPDLFGHCEVRGWTTFRVTRDSDLDLLEQEGDDMLQWIEQRIKARRRGDPVRIEVNSDAEPELVRQIVKSEALYDDETYGEVYRVPGPVDLAAMMSLVDLEGYDHLRFKPKSPRLPAPLVDSPRQDIFRVVRQGDVLLHHPYDAFDPVVDLISKAADDPQVLAIKQTLYRAGSDSPIVKALMRAAENGKQVTVLVELKARFDEQRNVSWARQLERAGVHVVFGFAHMKTHCKVVLIVRQEDSVRRRYVHMSTGNYNPTTARLYTDVGLMTCDEEVATDATAIFNMLTGYSHGYQWRHFITAPADLHHRTVELIEDQAERASRGEPSWIFAKINSLADRGVIEALYAASGAGVPIDLVVRGICCLRPGLAGISENIRVRSLVGRYLEHSRVFVFGPPSDNPRVFLGSNDWMQRNFFRRVEVMFPVLATTVRQRVLEEIVLPTLHNSPRARVLHGDGAYERLGR